MQPECKKRKKTVELAEDDQAEGRNYSDSSKEKEERQQKAEEGRQFVADLLAKEAMEKMARKERRRRAKASRRSSKASMKGYAEVFITYCCLLGKIV